MNYSKFNQFLLTVLISMVGAKALAYQTTIGGINYELQSNKTASVVLKTDRSYSGEITIPESVYHNGSTYRVTQIGGSAFAYCENLTSITLPSSVIRINGRAFYGCKNMTTINIPNSVQSIGAYAFHESAWYEKQADGVVYVGLVAYGYKGIMPPNTNIVYEEGTISISDFSNCENLISITIPKSVKDISSSTFSGCNNLSSVTFQCEEIDDWFSGFTSLKEVIIGENVTSINASAFYGCVGLTSIIISDNVKYIKTDAFNGCSSLRSITIPHNIETIEGRAFYGCSSLSSVTFNCHEIGGWFSGMTSLSEIILGNEVNSIKASAFSGCTGLTNVVIPESVTSIGDNAFENCNLLKTIRFQCGEIGSWFNGMSSIETVYIDDGVSVIGEYAFANCVNLTNVFISGEVTSICNNAFYNCGKLQSIEIPNSVKTIGNSAFEGCRLISSISIYPNVTNVGKYAFKDCSGLESVTISNQIATIDLSSFSGCNNISSLNLNCPTVGAWFRDLSSLKTISLGEKVSSLDSYAFYGCKGIEAFSIPDNVKSIGAYAFANCKIKSLTIGTGVQTIGSNAASPIKVIWLPNTPPAGYANVIGKVNYVANNLYTSINNKILYGNLSSLFECDGIKYVLVNPSERICEAIDCIYGDNINNINIGNVISYDGISFIVKEIRQYTCYANANIKNVNLSFDGNIGEYAFYECSGLEQLSLHHSGNIGSFAFANIISEFVADINNVGNIEMQAFYNSSGLKSLELGLNSANVGNRAFMGCSKLQFAEISNKGSIGDEAFSNCINLKTAIVNNRGIIGNKVFQNCSLLETVVFGDNLLGIGSYAFEDCSSLGNVIIPNIVSTIGEYAFKGCSTMELVKIGNGIKTIQTGVFSGCSMLSDIQIGSFVNTIKSRAFDNCSNLSKIVIPPSVTSIENYVFSGCSSLKNVVINDRVSILALGSNGSSPLFSDCPLDSVYIGGNISYSISSSYGYSPFYRNTSLQSVEITDKETEISENEFYGCTNLTNVNTGNGVNTIGKWAFSGCSSLTSFILGANIISIGDEAFSDCSALKEIVSYAVEAPVCGLHALGDINLFSCTLYVPAGSASSYSTTDQWKDFYNIIEEDVSNEWFQLTYVVDGEIYKTIELRYKDVIEPEQDPQKDGFTFSGWDEIPEKMPPHNVTVYGSFSINSYMLTYIVDGLKYKTQYLQYQSVITPEPEPTKEGYTFSGWGTIPVTMPACDVTIYGTFEKKTEKPIVETDLSNVDNVIYISSAEAWAGNIHILSVNMKNTAAIRGFQFDLYLPEGVTVAKSSKGKILGALSAGRLPEEDEHQLTFSEQPDGAIRFLCSSQYDETFTGNDGEIATLQVNIGEEMKDGDYAIDLKNVKLTETDISKYYLTDLVRSKLTVMTYILGDINNDKLVDVSDYTGVANHIHGNTPEGFNMKAADVDESGNIDVSDYTGIANIIHTGSIYGNSTPQGAPRMLKRANTNVDSYDNVIYITPFSAQAGEQVTVSLKMKNTADIRGFQFDLYLPEGVTVAKSNKGRIQGALSAGRLPDEDEHELTFSEQPDGAIRFLCSSQYDETFTGNDGELSTLKVNIAEDIAAGDHPILLKNMKLTETDISKFYTTELIESTLTIESLEPVTVTATSYTIKYGDAIPEFAFTSEGATLYGKPSITCEATATSPVGEYAIVITKGSVTNYNDHYVNGKLTIEKAPLTISGGTYTMKQGEELPTFVASYDGFKNEETEEVLTTKPTLTTTATSASEPGEYSVTVSGAEAQNYAISYVPGTLTVGAADAVTVTATSYTIKYGDAIPEFAFTSEGATLDGTPSITCEATATSPVGEYAIVITKGSVTNYNDHYVNGKLTIEKAPLTISGGTYTMKQGEELPAFVASYDGFKNEETEDVLTTKPTLTTTATSASEPGDYEVTVSGAEAQNYEISYVPGTLTITVSDGIGLTPDSSPTGEGSYYTLDGQKLQGKPTQKGLYIQNGRKIIVK